MTSPLESGRGNIVLDTGISHCGEINAKETTAGSGFSPLLQHAPRSIHGQLMHRPALQGEVVLLVAQRELETDGVFVSLGLFGFMCKSMSNYALSVKQKY